MGCCMSTATKRPSQKPQSPSNHRSPPKPHPSASLEEETVKEVLSETPISKPQPPPQTTTPPPTQHKNTQVPIVREERNVITNRPIREEERTPEISQTSEICSITDTLSTATTTTTTTVTEIREDEAMSKRRVDRSPAKAARKRPYIAERDRVAKSPAKRQMPPVRRELPGRARTAQRNVTSAEVKRGVGERSGRRSRSPATKTASGVGRGRVGGSPAKGNGKASGQSGEVGASTGVKREEIRENDSVLMQQQQQEEHHEQGQGVNESLENPLVSLECFIFL